jgi:hypothetical protein
MPQDRRTGAEGNRFGRANGKKLASELGATLVRHGSNEALWKGRRVVFKSAAERTKKIGVTYKMLERLDDVVAAMQQDDGRFALYILPAKRFKAAMVPTASRGSSSGRVGMVWRSVFERSGQPYGHVRLD